MCGRTLRYGDKMEHFFTYNKEKSRDFGVWISGSGTYNAPIRDIETVAVPGRNGLLVYDNGRYENIDVTYPAFIPVGFGQKVDAFRAFLTADVGYHRLEDTYHPDEFRLGYYAGGFEAEPTTRNLAGRFDITFSCKPQRFLKAGESYKSIQDDDVIYNPTRFPAKPLIKFTGNGTAVINGAAVTVSGVTGVTILDCDIQEVIMGDNSKVSFDEAPELAPGENVVEHTFTALDVMGRWWTL